VSQEVDHPTWMIQEMTIQKMIVVIDSLSTFCYREDFIGQLFESVNKSITQKSMTELTFGGSFAMR
jgi:hypothetical protein